MVNPSKQKGTLAETAVVEYLHRRGIPYAERRTQRGINDCGDISGIPGVMIEVKNEKLITLSVYADEVRTEKINARADVGAAWIKRRGKGDPGEWYVLLSGNEFINLLRSAGYVGVGFQPGSRP